MRVSQEEKERSRTRIVTSASRLFRKRGLEGASVADVMKDAGMTHGGFYKHFDSKDALVESAMESAFGDFVSALSDGEAAQAFDAYRALYLSDAHRTHPELGCPIAALGTEIARGPASLRSAFGTGVRRMIDAIGATRAGPATVGRKEALRELSMLVGAMVIARSTDPELADEVLSACRGEIRNVH